MSDLKPKMVLKSKGESAFIPLQGLAVTLKWTKSVDLDLMAFFTTKDGKEDGVYSVELGGTLGNMNAFPYMMHSGDAGIAKKAGEETIKIAKLVLPEQPEAEKKREIAQLYVVCLNFTDASEKKDAIFANYDGQILVTPIGGGDAFAVPLTAQERGAVAVVCRIDNTNPLGPQLINENRILSLADAWTAIPAFTQLAQKS